MSAEDTAVPSMAATAAEADELSQAATAAGDIKPAKKGVPLFLKILGGFTVLLIVLVVGGYIGLNQMRGKPPVVASETPGTNVLKNVPGDPAATAQYDNVQTAANDANYAAAKSANQSNVPTLRRGDIVDPPVQQPSGTIESSSPSEQQQTAIVREAVGQRIGSARKQYEEILKRGEASNDSYRASALAFVQPVPAASSLPPARDHQAAVAPKKRVLGVLKAGDRLTGEVDATVNSDYPGPVFVTIREGKFAGARLKGEFKLVSERIRLEFQSITLARQSKPQTINALAFDLNSTTYGLATDVDRHLLERYSGVFLSALAGAGQTLLQPRSTVTTLIGGAAVQTSERATYGDLGRSVAATGLSQVGQDIAASGKRPTTASIRQYELVGIVMTEPAEFEAGADDGQ